MMLRIRELSHRRRARIAAAIAVVLLVAAIVPWSLARSMPKSLEAAGFAVAPQGEEVSPLAPVKVTFNKAPLERDGSKLLSLEPKVEGQYAWVGERTLLFQPNFPGLLRGFQYTVNVAPAPDAGLDRPFVSRFTTSGELTVQTVIPAPNDTEVPSGAQILAQFSRSVAPLTILKEQSTKPVIQFDPPLAGTGEWLNTSLYRFIPERIAGNTTYRATIAAGLTSAADGVLKQDYVWTFTTFSPALDSISPEDNTTFASLRQKIVLRFNEPMDRASVAGGVVVKGPDGVVPGALAWSASDTVATFTPANALTRSAKYQVVVPKGLRGATGGASQTERTVTFTTIGLPGIASTEPSNGAKDTGRYGMRISFTNPMNADSFAGKVTISGIDAKKIDPFWAEDNRTLYLNAALQPSTKYTVSIAPGATDREGQPLPAYSFSFTTGSVQPFVSLIIPNQLATYSASLEPILYFRAANVSEAAFTLYPLTPDERDRILSTNQISPNPSEPRWTPSSAPLRSWAQPISAAKDEFVIRSTSLGDKKPLPKGDYLVRAGSGGYGGDLVFTVVDTTVVTKLSANELLAWVLDHDSGRKLAGVRVSASGPGLSGAIGVTDADGLVSFAVPDITTSGPEVRSRPYVVLVEDGGRRGVSSTYWSQGAQPYQLNIPITYAAPRYVAHVYTDRPIYRPGEEVFYKGVVRVDDDAAYSVPPLDLALQTTVNDANGKQLVNGRASLNEFGTIAGSFRVPDSAAIGDYFLFLSLAEGPPWSRGLANVTFSVAEFRKPEYEVTLEPGKSAYVAGDRIGMKATATYFFGGSVDGASGDWSARSDPYTMSVKGYERYSFSSYDYYLRPSVATQVVRGQGHLTTGAGGVATFSLPAVLQGDEGAQRYTVGVTVLDQNGQAVAANADVIVHPASLYAGIRPADYLAEIGKDARIDVVSVDTGGAVVGGRRVVVKVYERDWVTTKEETPEGGRRYRSDPVDTLVATLPLTTNDKGEGSVSYRPAKNGTLRLVAEITDAQGRVARSAAYLWVTGSGFASWRVTNDDLLQLVADKDKYEVGDTAEVLVPAPYQGAIGLVTVERGKIITRATRTFATNSERLRIPIVDRDVPNVFVSVLLYRAPTTADPVPRYKLGYVELPVSTKTRELNVSIRPDRAVAKPGDKVRYDLRVSDASGKGVRAELSLAVVDKAVLSLADERGPSGLAAFWFERGLGVATSTSLAVSMDRTNDTVVDLPKGGKGGAAGGGPAGLRVRQDFRNLTYWQAQLATNADGAASVEVTMPDNLTTWRMQARAVSGDTMVGEGTNELLSTQPLLLRPALPRFLRVGDKATIALLVRNATDKATDVTVSLAAEGVDVTGSGERTGSVAAGASTLFQWPAAVATAGTATFTFKATSSAGLADAVVQSIPVRLDVTPETTATGGVVTGDPLYEAVYFPSYAIASGGGLDVSVQPSITGSMSDELRQFDRQPWETQEETTKIASRIIATAGVRRANASAGAPTQALDAQIANDVATIVSRQRSDGGWSWCALYCESDPEVTGLTLIALGELRRDGQTVGSEIVGGGSRWAMGYLSRLTDVARPTDVNQKAFLLYAMAVADQPNAYLAQLRAMVEQHRAQLANFGRAYLLLGFAEAGQPKADSYVGTLLNDLAAAMVSSANGNHWEDQHYAGSTHTSTRTTALVLDALVRIDRSHPLIEETVRWLMVARAASGWDTYADRAAAVLALSEFAAATGELAGEYGYAVRLGESDVLTGQFKRGDGTKTAAKTLPLSRLDAGKMSILTFSKSAFSSGRLYYGLNLKYVTPARNVEALNRGVAVTHQYTALADEKRTVDRVKLGDVVRIRVTVVAPAELQYVTVDDFLPAGLEPIDPQLRITDANVRVQLERERASSNRPSGVDYWAPWFHWYYSPWQQSEIRDDHVTLKAQWLPKGVHEFVYYARATSAGDYFVAPAHAEEGFFPEVFGRSDSGRFVVEP